MMITLPNDILTMIETIEKAGCKAYAVGGSVRDALLGIEPADWDLAATATAQQIVGFFPGSRIIGEKYGVVRVEVGGTTADVAGMRIDGNYSDYRRPDEVIMTDLIEEDLARRDFTINGMAFSPTKGLIDPFGGQRDIKARMLRAIGKADERFTEDPLRILRGLRFSGQLGFDIALETFMLMQKTAPLLKEISMDRRREEFEKLLVSPNAGKALRMCGEAGVMPFLLAGCYPPDGERETANYMLMLQNIDRSKPETDCRLTILFFCFEKYRAVKAASALGFGADRIKRLDQILELIRELCLVTDRYEVKQLICTMGREQFEYVAAIAEEIRKVFSDAQGLIENRCQLLTDIKNSGEPVFMEDLAVDGNDLLRAGYQQGEEIGETLSSLLQAVHKDPAMNEKNKLMKSIKRSNTSLRDMLRGVGFKK